MRRHGRWPVAGLVAAMLTAAPAAALTLEELGDEQRAEAEAYVIGNAVSVLFHEAGHMLVSEFELPVLGREEDAVDALSTVWLLEREDEAVNQMLRDAADAWFLTADSAEELDEGAFWGAHGLDRQRGYAMTCLMVGKDPEAFREFADTYDLPEDRRAECAVEYETARDAWFRLLDPHFRDAEGSAEMTIVYDDPEDDALREAADILKREQVLEQLAESLGSSLRLDDGITLRATTCGEANAYWNPEDRSITYCYEYAAFHLEQVLAWMADQPDEAAEESGDEGAE